MSRDEAEHEEKQAEVRERAENADRERRRQLLLQRARQRFGVRRARAPRAQHTAGANFPTQLGQLADVRFFSAQLLQQAAGRRERAQRRRRLRRPALRPPSLSCKPVCLPLPGCLACHPPALHITAADPRPLLLLPLLPQDRQGAEAGAVQVQAPVLALPGPPADARPAGWQADAAAMRGLAAGQADHCAALEAQVQQGAPTAARRGGDGQARASRKRERRQQQQQQQQQRGPPPTLAQLASQLHAPDGGAPPQPQQQEREVAVPPAAQQERPAKMQRFNLFAEEEEAAAAARRKNPEAEVGAPRRPRGSTGW